MAYKMVIISRQDLNLPKGKLAVQVAHAAVECALKSERRLVDRWRSEGGKKIVLKVEAEKELLRFMQAANDAGLKNYLVSDAGLTTVPPGTITCLGIGPDEDALLDRLTK